MEPPLQLEQHYLQFLGHLCDNNIMTNVDFLACLTALLIRVSPFIILRFFLFRPLDPPRAQMTATIRSSELFSVIL